MQRAERKKSLVKRRVPTLNFGVMSRIDHPLLVRSRFFVLFKKYFGFWHLDSVFAKQRKHFVSVGCFGHFVRDVDMAGDVANGSYFLLGYHQSHGID